MWDFNWIAIVLAALAGFLVGGLWYGPLFSKAWVRETGLSEEQLKASNKPMIFGTTFVLNLFSSYILAHVFRTYGDPGISLSVMIAGGIALGFILPAIAINYLFSLKSVKLFMIDGGYWLLIYSLMGAIFGAFSANA